MHSTHSEGSLARGAECRVRFPFPHRGLLRHDVEGNGEGVGALHDDMCLRDAYQLASEHWDHWHDDRRLACGHLRLLVLLPIPVAGLGQLWLCPLVTECFAGAT